MEKTETRGNGKKDSRLPGVVKLVGQSKLSREFITIGDSFEEALGRCVLRDDEQKNCIIVYKAQLQMFDMDEEIQDLTNWLNASAAVGGFNRSLASMTESAVYYPTGAGIKVSKEDQKALMEIQKQRAMAKGRGSEANRDGGKDTDEE